MVVGACGRAGAVYPLCACGLRKQGHQCEWGLAACTRTQPHSGSLQVALSGGNWCLKVESGGSSRLVPV